MSARSRIGPEGPEGPEHVQGGHGAASQTLRDGHSGAPARALDWCGPSGPSGPSGSGGLDERDLRSRVCDRIEALRALVDRELRSIAKDLASSGWKAAPGPSARTSLAGLILRTVPPTGWAKVTVLLKLVRASTQAKYAAVRELVAEGLLARRHGYVARRAWVDGAVVEDFGSGSVSCNTAPRRAPEGRPGP